MVRNHEPMDLVDLREFEPDRYWQIKSIIELKNAGFTNLEVSIKVGLSERQIYRILKQIRLQKTMEGNIQHDSTQN